MNIFFPIETLSRELDYKLILAHRVAIKFPNSKVYIGSVNAIHELQNEFFGGVYVGNTIFTSINKKKNIVTINK